MEKPPASATFPEYNSHPPADMNKHNDKIEIHQVPKSGSDQCDAVDDEKGLALRPSKSPAHPIISFWRRKKELSRHSEIATQPSVFDDPVACSFFAPPATYENAHRFDPHFRWTWGEELEAVSKLDWRITLWTLVLFVIYDMNRSNLIQANTDNFLPDLGMDTNDYNLGLTVLRATAVCAELPAQLLARKVGLDRFMPLQMFLWGCVSVSQFWLTGRTTFLVTRFFIALFSAAIVGNTVLYLSYFFTSAELPYRLTIFVSGNRVNDIISPLLALGILRLRGTAGKAGWRWLFLIEGCFTLLVALWSWYIMTPSLTQTKTRLRPKGWFSERQEKILVNRLLRDDPSKSSMHNRERVTLALFWQAVTDYDLWPLYLMALLARVPGFTPDLYFTLILRSLGFSTSDTNLLSIPPYVIFLFSAFAATLLAEKLNQRCFATFLGQLWTLPAILALVVIPISISNRWAVYSLYTIILSGPTVTGYFGGWLSRNSNSVATRSIGATIFGMTIQASLLISSNIYRENDRPAYRAGNRALLGIVFANIVLVGLVKYYYTRRNAQRARVWDAMSAEDRAQYLEDHQHDMGARRLDFRFVS
ncbi:unnamed protein product [Discula destructiva]